jgi:probable HAF family extracellular repeat protein
VVGTSVAPNLQTHPFLYSNGAIVDLVNSGLYIGTSSGNVSAINASGQIVGTMSNSSHNGPFLYSKGNGYWLDMLIPGLVAAGWRLTEVVSINDNGLIIGRGWLNGQPLAFLLEPIK